MKCLWIIIAVVTVCSGLQLNAQIERVLPRRGTSSLEGTSFVVGFMQNEILEVGTDPRLQIFIASQYDANVTIESALTGRVTVPVAANTVHVETMSPIHANDASEIQQQKSVFITSDVPVVVYVLNTLAQSTDTYAAIPIRHLGTQYYSINRPTDHYPRSRNVTSSIPRVGEFMVMAVEDGTRVTIVPNATTRRIGVAPKTPLSVTLNKGECYLVQARPTRYGRDDLTGSSINSSKPVAVISGHMRSSIPLDSAAPKDHLVEQLIPVTKWGRTYVTAPFAMTTRPDMFRVMASLPGQTITLTTRTSTKTYRLPDIGSWADTLLSEPASWQSADPFFLVQMMASQIGNQVNYDPAMVIAPPVEQFVNESLFRFPTLEADPQNPAQQFYYFINLVATSDAMATLEIDGRSVATMLPQMSQQVVPGTTIHWSRVQLTGGSHRVTCDSGSFSAVMYGTSRNDSYANLVGISFEPLVKRDFTPPSYTSNIDCGTINGTVRDVSKDTARLAEVTVIDARTFNYEWTISEPVDSSGAVDFQARVVDMSRDAQLVIHAYDDRGNGKEWLYRYEAPAIDVQKEVVFEAQRSRERCTTVVIRNRDLLPVTIRSLTRQGNQRIFIANPTRSFTIAPRDSAVVTICATQWADTAAMAASIIIELPCGLIRTFYVKTRVSASIRGDTVDLGDVRLGETACGKLAIVNHGDAPVDVEELISSTLDTCFTVDTASLRLPRSIRPGDSVLVDVCFRACSLGDASRTDTVISTARDGVLLVTKARGVRPRIGSIVIDWRERYVGSVNDTSFVLRNDGNGWCVASLDRTPASAMLTIDRSDLEKGGRLVPGDSIALRATFSPSNRDTLAEELPVIVDWAPHEKVTIQFRGIGVMPDAEVQDINFGTIVVDTRRDSLADLLWTGFSGGNAPLHVYDVRIIGPDSSSFLLPPSLLALVGDRRSRGSKLADSVSFVPKRLGMHECFVEVDHNAAPAGERAMSRFRLYGRAIERPRADIITRLQARQQVSACTQEDIVIDLTNQGNLVTRIDTIHLWAGSDRIDVTQSVGSFDLLPGQSWTHSVGHFWDNTSVGVVGLRVVDSAGTVLTDSMSVIIEQPKTTISLAFINSSGAVAGPAWLSLTAALENRQDVPLPVEMRVFIDQMRFVLGPVDSSRAELSAVGNTTILPATLRQDSTSIIISSQAAIQGPWVVSCRLFGTLLWKDPDPDSMVAVLEGTPCYSEQQSQKVPFGIDPCGSRRRIVTIGSRPGITVRPLGQPFHDQIRLEIESSSTTSGKVWIESLSGEHFLLSEHLSLQKGLQHCNFSCSRWSSGLYRLVFILEHGAEVTNIIIVN